MLSDALGHKLNDDNNFGSTTKPNTELDNTCMAAGIICKKDEDVSI